MTFFSAPAGHTDRKGLGQVSLYVTRIVTHIMNGNLAFLIECLSIDLTNCVMTLNGQSFHASPRSSIVPAMRSGTIGQNGV
jgi:hypothetical protein